MICFPPMLSMSHLSCHLHIEECVGLLLYVFHPSNTLLNMRLGNWEHFCPSPTSVYKLLSLVLTYSLFLISATHRSHRKHLMRRTIHIVKSERESFPLSYNGGILLLLLLLTSLLLLPSHQKTSMK